MEDTSTPHSRSRSPSDVVGLELLASWGPANQAKSDAGPGDWLPPDTTFRCDYVLRFLRIAAHYDLAIGSGDAAAVQRTTRYCGG